MSGDEEWVGIAVYQSEVFLLTGVLAEFVLDYRAYDPAFCAGKNAMTFRQGVLTVTADAVPLFLRALKARPIAHQEGQTLATPNTASDLLAFIDCDSRTYVHSYYDLPLEDYVPEGWRGKLGDPREALKEWYSKEKGEKHG